MLEVSLLVKGNERSFLKKRYNGESKESPDLKENPLDFCKFSNGFQKHEKWADEMVESAKREIKMKKMVAEMLKRKHHVDSQC